MDRYKEIKAKVLEYAEKDDDITAVVAIGSSARSYVKADEYSDLDLMIATADPGKWYSGEYPDLFGTVNIAFTEPTIGGGRERRCIYDEDKDVDFIVLTPDQLEDAVASGVAAWVMNRGYCVLYDSRGISELLEKNIASGISVPQMTADEFNNTVNDFFFHNIWTCKKLLRGELWAAKMCLDSYMKNRLLSIIELYCSKVSGQDVWHDGRFIDTWADDFILDGLRTSFARYDKEDVKQALLSTHMLFARVARAAAVKMGYVYPDKAETTAADYLKKHL